MSIQVTKKDGSVEGTFTGCVISVDTNSERVMSDIWEMHTTALVFNNETAAFERRFLYSDYGPSSGDEKRSATVDASDEIKALYAADQAVEEAKRILASAEAGREERLRDVRRPGRGKIIKAVKGRKIPVGTVGECTWFGESCTSFGYQGSTTRVGMQVDGKVVYTDARNIQVVVG